MAGNKLIFLNSLKLIFLIILNFGKIPQIGGTCSSLTSTSTISVRCLYNGTPLEHCEDPIDGTAVLILCLYQEYSLQQDIIPVCRNGQWSPSIPKCYTINSEAHSEVFGQSNLPSPQTRSNSICPSLTSSASTNFKCKHDVKPLENCENPLNETTVLISCNPSYEESSLQIDPIRLCINGKWSSTIPECKPSRYVAPTTTSERSYPLFGGQTTSTNHSNCESLASTESTNVRCYLNRKYLQNCQNPVHGTLVIIGCNSQYEESSLQYNSTRECRDGKWSSSIPQCTSIYGAAPFKSFKQFNPSLNNQASRHSVCPSLTSSTTINIKCILNGKLLNNCENVTNGTIAIISCNPFYTQPSLRNNPSRICKEGQWSASIPECYPSRPLLPF